jgi:hypothetical protein
MPLLPDARINRALVDAHEPSRRDRNSAYWTAVRAAVPPLSKEEAHHVAHLTVIDLPIQDHITSTTVLDGKLDTFVKTSLLRTAPQEQMKRNGLLYGPPGTGKTYAVHALAARHGLMMISIKYSDIHDKFVGESGKVLSAAVRLAWKHQPVLMFLDEVENMAGRRDTGSAENHDAHVTSELLAVMHGGATAQPGLMIICCTNLRHRMDSAALDRFLKQFEVLYPDAATRAAVWANILRVAGITLTDAEFQQVQLYPLPTLREIGRVVTAWEELETEDTSELLRIAEEMSAEPESDAELEEFFIDQRPWRGFASKYMKGLLPADWPDSSDRIHIAIPSHMGGTGQWEGALVKGAAQVLAAVGDNTDVFKLCLDEQNRGCWCLRRTDQKDIPVMLNLNNTVNIRGQGDEDTMKVQRLQQQITSLQQQIISLERPMTGRGATTEKKDQDDDGGEGDLVAEEEKETTTRKDSGPGADLSVFGEEDEDHASGVLVDRMLQYIGFTEGRGSKSKLSKQSMQQAIEAATPFSESEITGAKQLLMLDLTMWTADNLFKIKSQLRKHTDLVLERTQLWIDGENTSVWGVQ